MDRADRTEGIRLIARVLPLSLFLSRATAFSFLFFRASLPSRLPLILALASLPERGIFMAETIFNSDRRPPPHLVLALARARITANAIRNRGEFATLALNTRRGNEPIRTSNNELLPGRTFATRAFSRSVSRFSYL